MFGLDFILKLKPCKWRYKKPLDDGVEHFGFIAQEVDELVSKDEYAFVKLEGGVYKVVLGEFIGPIVKAIQELNSKVKELEKKYEPSKLGNNEVGNHDPVGSGHDLEKDVGDIRRT